MLRDMRGLYAIIDPDHCHGRTPLALAQAVLAGGCAALQLRAKRGTDSEHEALARALLAACRDAGVPFVVNDRVALAARVGADGLHLGQDDCTLAMARQRFDGHIGLSTHSAEQAADAFARGADLIGFGPVFATATKDNPDPVVGTEALAQVCASAPRPVVAIGGITEARLPEVVAAGAPCAAAIGALSAPGTDPQAAAHRIHHALLTPPR